MFRVEFRTGKGGRIRWFVARKDTGRIMYSCFPLSFGTDQEAWEHAEWALVRALHWNTCIPFRDSQCSGRTEF